MELTGIARIPLALLDEAEELGLQRDDLLRQAGLREEDLRQPDTRVSTSKIENLWRVVIAGSRIPSIGLHVGTALSARRWGLVGYTMAYSTTLGQALERLSRYMSVMSEASPCEIELEGQRGTFLFTGGLGIDYLGPPVDARLASVLGVMREITGVNIVPLEALFAYPRPENTSEHARYFGCPLCFGRPASGLVLRRDDLQRPISTADEELCGYLDRLAQEIMESLGGEETFTARVHQAIWAELSGGPPTLQETARALGISTRTMQRQLKEEGTTYAEVLDALRREMAAGLLLNHTLAIYEVAFLLGYSEPSTFYRAFRRWHGMSPGDYRREEN
jgi:AraC-like DNA-binding protein